MEQVDAIPLIHTGLESQLVVLGYKEYNMAKTSMLRRCQPPMEFI